jgi:hypothetical protein
MDTFDDNGNPPIEELSSSVAGSEWRSPYRGSGPADSISPTGSRRTGLASRPALGG